MSEPTSPESPWQVRDLNKQLTDYISRLGYVWVEGQLAQVKHRPGHAVSFAQLRDVDKNKSTELTCSPEELEDHKAGDKVLVLGKPQYWGSQGSMSFRAKEIRSIGIGDLRAGLEKLKKQLYNEGLFDPKRKKALPRYPQRIGLITGKNSAAERDVISVATNRWPHVQFDVRHVLVQGKSTVLQVMNQVQELDADPGVDLIVIARGGGSFEDLLPFSNENLVRLVYSCDTPTVSAIGHEPDNPLLDDVADLRAATPTDAAKRIVPNLWDEVEKVETFNWTLDERLGTLVNLGLQDVVRYDRRLDQVMRDPTGRQRKELEHLTHQLDSAVSRCVYSGAADANSLALQLDAMNPKEILIRGYSVVSQEWDPATALNSVYHMSVGDRIRIRMGDGIVFAQVTGREEE